MSFDYSTNVIFAPELLEARLCLSAISARHVRTRGAGTPSSTLTATLRHTRTRGSGIVQSPLVSGGSITTTGVPSMPPVTPTPKVPTGTATGPVAPVAPVGTTTAGSTPVVAVGSTPSPAVSLVFDANGNVIGTKPAPSQLTGSTPFPALGVVLDSAGNVVGTTAPTTGGTTNVGLTGSM